MQDIAQLEKFLFSQNKQTVLDELIPYQDLHQFFSTLYKIHEKKITTEEFDKFIQTFPRTSEKQMLQIKFYFDKLQNSKSDEERKTYINTLNNHIFKESFNDQQKVVFEQGGLMADPEQQLKSALTKDQLEKLLFNNFLETFYADPTPNLYDKIERKYRKDLDFSKIPIERRTLILQIVADLENQINPSNATLKPFLINAIQKYNDLNENNLKYVLNLLPFECHQEILKKTNLISKKVFFNELFQRAFDKMDYDTNKYTIDQLRQQTSERIKFIESSPQIYHKNSSQLRKNLLITLFQNNKTDEDLLIKYLENPLARESLLVNSQSKSDDFLMIDNCPTDYKILQILELTLMKQKTTNGKLFEKYFDRKELDLLLARVQFFKGEKVDLKNFFTDGQIKEMNEKKILSLRGKNEFKENDSVEIEVELKNIKKLNVRVFEVNTENFLVKEQGTNFDSIDVNFLIPSEEYAFTFEKPSHIIHHETLKFDTIAQKKFGVFIVYLIGDETYAKAIITKGKLALVYDQICGRNCMIVDECQNICISSRSGIYIKNKFLQADQNGIVQIPEEIDSFNEEIIVVHEGFAVKQNLNIQDFKYELDFTVLFNSEEIIPGRQAKFVCPINLSLNGNKISNEQLKDVTIEIQFTKNNGVNQKKEFNNISLKKDQDLVIETIIPSKVISINFTLKAQVPKKQKVELLANKSIHFQRINDSDLTYTLLEKDTDNNYNIKLIGPNGETVSDKKVQIRFFLKTHNCETSYDLVSDEEGKIKLGDLSNCHNIEVIGEGFSNTLYLKDSTNVTQLPEKILALEDQNIIIQNPANEKLIRYYSHKAYQKNLFDFIKNQNGQIEIQGLPEGQYTLYFEDSNVDLQIIKGKLIELNGQKIASPEGLLSMQKKRDTLGILVNQSGDQIKAEIKGNQENTKCHVILSNNILQEGVLNIYFQFQDLRNEQQFLFEYSKSENNYYNNGRLNDELVYVYNRRGYQNFMGNTLEKPGTILKREKVQQTDQDVEKIRESVRAEKCMARSANKRNLQEGHRLERAYLQQIKLLEFLSNDQNQQFQMLPNQQIQEGQLVLNKGSLGKYRYVYIYVRNDNGVAMQQIVNQTQPIPNNDLTLQENRKTGSVFRYDRQMDFIGDKKEFSIPHVSKQEFSMLENTKDLFNVFKIISNNSKLCDFEYLSTWQQLSNQEKLKKYDKDCCHEFNLFVYFKDKTFFDGVVLPFIQNKKEKSLIDNILIGNHDELKKSMNISNLAQMNIIEKILLYTECIKYNQEFANSIYDEIKMKAQLNKFPEDQFKKNFDSILQSSKKEESNEEQIMVQQFAQISNTNNLMFSNMAVPQQSYQTFGSRGQQRMMNLGRPMQHLRQVQEQRYMDTRYDECEEIQYDADYLAPPPAPVQIFKPTEATVEYKERTYYDESPSFIYREIWNDLIEYYKLKGTFQNFFSQNFIEIKDNFSEMLLLFSVIDLPFENDKCQSELKDDKLIVHTGTRLIVLSKEIIEEEGVKSDQNIMIRQRFFDKEDKYIYSEENPDLQFEKPVKDFVKRKVYQSNLVITNPTSIPMKIQIIHEIPRGSIPYGVLDTMKIEYTTLEPLQSINYQMEFYFPKSGKYSCYPATVVQENKILGMANIEPELEVLEKKKIDEMRTIKDILSGGKIEDIKEFIATKNLHNPNIFNVGDIIGLLKNENYYKIIISGLRSRGFYDKRVWKYSLMHGDIVGFRDYLNDSDVTSLLKKLVIYLKNDLIEINDFQLLEYYPLVNPRTFSLDMNKKEILNKSFKSTYQKFLMHLFTKIDFDIKDKIILVNYLLCQDRISEAIEQHKLINESEIGDQNCRIQYDYQTAYLDFINGFPEFKVAKKISEQYLTYPILTWRNLFVEIVNQISEFEESELIEQEEKDKEKKTNAEKAKTESSFTCKLVDNNVIIDHENLKSLVAKFYKIDLEAFYSLKPFQEGNFEQYTYVIPFMYKDIELISGSGTLKTVFKIPEEIEKENLFIEFNSGEGFTKTQYLNYIPFTLNHYLNSEFGILKVVNPTTNKPVPKIYMKCFAKYKNGNEMFYKDGFTDIRGSFDYVSLNKDNLDDISKFRILIHSNEFGSKIIDANPPQKIGRIEGKAKELISDKWRNQQKQVHTKNAYQNVLF